MRKLKYLLVTLVMAITVLSLAPTASAAAVWYVDDNCAPPTNGSSADPFCSVQEAVNTSAPGDTIYVKAGTYPESVNIDKSLMLFGPRTGADATVTSFNLGAQKILVSDFAINPLAGTAGVTTSGSFAGYIISRNVITGGSVGIDFSNNGSAANMIDRNEFANNSGQGYGILTTGSASNTTIERNQFRNLANNSVRSLNPSSKLTIQYNLSTSVRTPFHIGSVDTLSIARNTSSAFLAGGSGIYLAGGNTNGTIEYNTITGPSTYHGIDVDGVLGTNTNLSIQRNTITSMGAYGILLNPFSLATSAMDYNTIESSTLDGIFISAGGNGELSLRSNRLKSNIEHDLHDNTVGVGTSGTANVYLYNRCNTSMPAGLCYAANP